MGAVSKSPHYQVFRHIVDYLPTGLVVEGSPQADGLAVIGNFIMGWKILMFDG